MGGNEEHLEKDDYQGDNCMRREKKKKKNRLSS